MEDFEVNTLTKKQLQKLRKCLPKGFTEIIAEKLDLSIGYVYMVLAGRRKNMQIIRMAVEGAENHKLNIENLVKKIDLIYQDAIINKDPETGSHEDKDHAKR